MTDRVAVAVDLLSEAETRIGLSRGDARAYLLVGEALSYLRDELANRMLEAASAEIAALVDIHGLIDDVAGDDRAQGFR